MFMTIASENFSKYKNVLQFWSLLFTLLVEFRRSLLSYVKLYP